MPKIARPLRRRGMHVVKMPELEKPGTQHAKEAGLLVSVKEVIVFLPH